jgi:hypothetical protein
MKYGYLESVYERLGWLQGLLSVFSVIVPALLKADPDQIKNIFGDSIKNTVIYIQQNTWWIILILLTAIFLIDRYRKIIGNPKDWGIIQYWLNDLREKVFSNCLDEELHHHRITLFKHCKFYFCNRKWPWSGWLIPVIRSGHTTQKSNSYFMAPDQADKVEGVVGQTWSRNVPVYVPRLPDLSIQPTEEKIIKYAKSTWVSPESVNKRKFPQRSYYGIPVEVNGKLWGVIIIDSYNAQLRLSVIRKAYNNVAKVFDKVLEGI